MTKRLLQGIILLQFICFGQQTVNYTPSTEIIANPERGLQKYSITDGNYSTNSDYSNLNTNTLTSWRTSSDKVTVIFRYFLLEDFLDTDINQTYLDNMQLDFDAIRTAGLKSIIRFSYANSQGNDPQQPELSQILSHINQLEPILETNKDIILSHQAGFIGTWGEWYYTNSSEFGTDGDINTQQWTNRKTVVDAMLAATPENIPIQVRYVGIKLTMYGITPLNESTAYQNTPNARVGFFNDAFLNNWGDQGTYSVNSANENPVGTADYTYLANETKYLPMTGETNGTNSPRTGASNAVLEMDSTNWTTLNRDYFTAIWNNWISDGKYDDILKGLGYRFVLESSTLNLDGEMLNLEINLRNEGYARLIKKRNAYLVLENEITGDKSTYLLNSDPRTWENDQLINQNVDLSYLPEGSYKSYMFLPDFELALNGNPSYSIQFANEDLWDFSTGMNDLKQVITLNTGLGNNNPTLTQAIQLFPNPTTSLLSFSESVKYEMFNTTGLLLLKGEGSSVDLSGFNSGVYMVKIEGEIYTVIKE